MRFFSEIKHIFHCDMINISERMNTVETSVPFNITVHDLPEIVSFQSLCSIVPSRDKFTLTLKNDSGDPLFISNQQVMTDNFSEFLSGMDSDDILEVTLKIDKSIDSNKFSIYDFDSFAIDLLSKPLIEVLEWFSNLLSNREYLVFEVYDYDISFSTSTMAFVSNKNALFTPKISRNQKLNTCKETSYFYNMNTFEVIPDDFKIEGVEHSKNRLKPFFGKLATILSFVYVGSASSITKDELNIQINGQRTATYTLKLDAIHENPNWLSIYSWIYTDGNSTDKSIIAHNVISLHCKYAPLLDIDEKVFDSIKSNYRLYLRNNVEQYLDLKRDISKFIQNVVAQVGDYAVSILNKFRTNLIAIFAFFFTIVLTRIGTAQKWDDIFTRHTIYLIEIVIIGSLGYLVICIFESVYKLNKAKHAYNELKTNYNEILSETEIKEAFGNDKLLKDAESAVKTGMIVWSIVWGVLLITAIIIIETLTVNKGLVVWLWNKIF